MAGGERGDVEAAAGGPAEDAAGHLGGEGGAEGRQGIPEDARHGDQARHGGDQQAAGDDQAQKDRRGRRVGGQLFEKNIDPHLAARPEPEAGEAAGGQRRGRQAEQGGAAAADHGAGWTAGVAGAAGLSCAA